MTSNINESFPHEGMVRANRIIGDQRRGITPYFPVSRTQWYRGVKQGIYPKGVKLSTGVMAWDAKTIRSFVESFSNSAEANQ